MPKFYDEQTEYEQGGDNGQNTAASIQPIAGAEPLWEAPLNRAAENLRKRTEVLRDVTDDLRYYADYDRALLVRSSATFTFTEPVPASGEWQLNMAGVGDLWVYPALTPGRFSGGRSRGARMFVDNGGSWVPYAGTLGVNDLSFTASAVYTGMRGYNDSDNFAGPNGQSLGGNRLTVTLVANPALPGGVGSITATVTGNPAVDITITYGSAAPATTLAQLIGFVNADVASQGAYGLSNLIFASTTSGGASVPPAITGAVFQGGYDSEAHKITQAALSAFFAAVDGGGNFINRLREGEGLALGFTPGPVEVGPAAKGGRRQAIWDLPTNRAGGSADNTAPLVGWNLFNTGREPEKIPGSVPVGKMINGQFVFIDGTLVGSLPVSLGESATTLARLAATAPTPGASLIGYGGSGPWHPDDGTSIPAGTLEASLDAVVSDLASDGVGTDGALKIGAAPHTGSPSLGNLPFSLTASSINVQIDAMLNGAASPSSGGGINYRVSEYGHVLKGYSPISKDLSALATAGGKRLEAQLTATGLQNVFAPTRAAREEYADIVVQPISVAGVLFQNETLQAGAANDQVALTEATIAARFAFLNALLPSMQTYNEIAPGSKALSACIMVQISGAVPVAGSDANGYYLFSKLVLTGTPTYEVKLVKMDGTAPNFAATNFAAASLTFLNTHIRGNNSSSNFERSFHYAENLPEKVVALAGVGNPWLETYYANVSGIGADAVKGSLHLASKSIWNPTLATPRDSDNILGTADKELLDGTEDGLPVNANTSHHHGVSAGRLIRTATSNLTFINNGTTGATLAQLFLPGGDFVMLPTPPTGHICKAAVMEIHLQLDSTIAAATLSRVEAEVLASAGGAFNIGTSLRAAHEMYLKQNGGLVSDVRDYYIEVTLEPDAARQIAFQTNLTTVDTNSVTSGINVSCRFLVVSRTTAVAGQVGASASISGVVANEQTVTGLTGMTIGAVGMLLEIAAAASTENNGVFLITGFNSATSVNIRNPLGTLVGDANNGFISWQQRFSD